MWIGRRSLTVQVNSGPCQCCPKRQLVGMKPQCRPLHRKCRMCDTAMAAAGQIHSLDFLTFYYAVDLIVEYKYSCKSITTFIRIHTLRDMPLPYFSDRGSTGRFLAVRHSPVLISVFPHIFASSCLRSNPRIFTVPRIPKRQPSFPWSTSFT